MNKGLSPLQKYIKFVFEGYSACTAVGINNQDIANIGGLEKMRSVLHDKAAQYLMDLETIKFETARERVKQIVEDIHKYPPEGGLKLYK